MTRASKHPTLPQSNTPQDRDRRRAQIASTAVSYQWTTTLPTLLGVPLAAAVPLEEKPTLRWFARVAAAAAEVAANVVAYKLSRGTGLESIGETNDGGAALRDRDRIVEIQRSLDGIVAAQSAAPRREGVLESVVAEVEGVEEAVVESTELVEGHLDELRHIIDTHSVDASPAQLESLHLANVSNLSAYEALFKTIPLPPIASTFRDDATFARLRVSGPNPMLLRGIDALPSNLPLSDATYAKVMGDGDTLAQALADGRVYLLDYVELQSLVPGAWEGLPKFPYAPLALFAVPRGGSSLVPVAIQCGQDPASHPIFTPASDGPDAWGWQMAKTAVQVADGNYHELYVHLARTHLVMEAFAIATHRHLAEEHPLWALLIPHVEGTLFINNAAGGSLIAANGPIDHIFAGTIASTQATAVADRLSFDFYGSMLPRDLAARKVDQPARLPDYPYRDDALLIWTALHDWASQYVGIYYLTDGDVVGDDELQGWAAALAADGKISGFKPITTRAQLIDVCTMVMFTGSAQHAAVNFPQKDVMTFAPAVTGAGWAAVPMAQAGHQQPEWLAELPPLALAQEQLNTLWLLGSVHYNPLGAYETNRLINLAWFRDPAVTGNALPRFQAELAAAEAQIDARNQTRAQPYPYLKPSLIPTSINI